MRGVYSTCTNIYPTHFRIIPAHAGFTATSDVEMPWNGDHPRTRGVYTPAHISALRARGSSPHTRGLPARAFQAVGERGIIPAHAGFTTPRSGSTGRDPDHPRTRGVYLDLWGARPAVVGSSPHTRGLPRRAAGRPPPSRIIPAHAGFTWAVGRCTWRGLDHPRTRGVYCDRERGHAMDGGSSPHTRGLQPQLNDNGRRERIIPAHAGFTQPENIRGTPCSDHPRTRGVYVISPLAACIFGGSSPHTRGLRGDAAVGDGQGGIIPAHAGFTRLAWCLGMSVADHPRTRGVYGRLCRASRGTVGSSPHTRGLRR